MLTQTRRTQLRMAFKTNHFYYTRTLISWILCSLFTALFFACSKTEDPNKSDDKTLFKRVHSEVSGIHFKNQIKEKYEYFEDFPYFYNGGGVAIGDINNDGLQDIFFTGNTVPNRLYLNKGDIRFEDISEKAGISNEGGWNNGVATVDINHDGYLDLYVSRGGWQDKDSDRANLLFVNQKDKTFKEEASKYGIGDTGYSVQSSFFDFDNDNDLDLYVMNRPDEFYLPLSQVLRLKEKSPDANRDKFYVNENGSFIEMSREKGIKGNFGYGLGVVTADVNNDGFTDIYVANDFAEHDYLYINQQGKGFKEQIKEATNHISLYSMGVDIMDINNDGLEDVIVMEMMPEDHVRSKISMPSMNVEMFNESVSSGLHYQYMHNMLHLNRGNTFFSEISQLAGIAKTDWSWSGTASDLDNDGHKDIMVTNGYRRDIFDNDVGGRFFEFFQQNKSQYRSAADLIAKRGQDIIDLYNPIKARNYIFQNLGNLTFKDVSEAWGFKEKSFSNGASVGDLDNDGDLDLVVNNLEEEAFVFENTTDDQQNYLRVGFSGPEMNPMGIGAKVTLKYNGQIQYQEHKTVRGYLSSHEPCAHFGLGGQNQVDTLTVEWPDGRINQLLDIPSNQVIDIKYEEALEEKRIKKETEPLFVDITDQSFKNVFRHQENEFDDYQTQELLPHRLSRAGPAISVADVNNDGLDDLYVGGASGQSGALYIQKKGGSFINQKNPVFEGDKEHEDVDALFIDVDGDNDMDLYVVSGGSEFPLNDQRYQDRLYLNSGVGKFTKSSLPKMPVSGSCVSGSDVDADGDLDLFVGGKLVPDNYPQSADSYFLLNENGKFIDRSAEVLGDDRDLGMVNSSVWTDLDRDGLDELVVVGEWMAIRIFTWQNEKLTDVSKNYFPFETTGWWNVVRAVDVDLDGDLDLIAGNLGTNYKFKASVDEPFHVYAADFDRNGRNDIFLAQHYKSGLVPVRGKECSSSQLPILEEKFPTYASFAHAGIKDILGPGIASAEHREVVRFSTSLFINEAGVFEPVSLPMEVQFSPVNDILINDFDDDGLPDIMLVGNNYDVEIETTRSDASTGVYLRGLGNNKFRSVDSWKSGLFVPENVKKMRPIVIDGNESVLLGINNSKLKLLEIVHR